ncbi:hypothetical protein E4U54_006983 [Claviceps lovelessii]|nr:hypothetical protein E4U54_006983 [Claviceps lovelessii]
MTIISAPFIYWKLDNDIASARFLTELEKAQAVERLRANQTGTGSREFRWSHLAEAALEPKTYLWIGMALCLNALASVTNTFGPLIISGLVSDKFTSTLLNIPFGAVQVVVIVLACYLAQRARLKGAVLVLFMLPVAAGLAVLFSVRRDPSARPALLVGYYLLAFMYGGIPLIVTWIVGNTAGTTKKSVAMSVYNAATSAGNIIGPLLFDDKDAPTYKPGLRSCLALVAALVATVALQWANLVLLNRRQEKKRVRNGKAAKVPDLSMQSTYHAMGEQDRGEAASQHAPRARLGDQAFLDLTDRENDEFIYIY